MQRLRGLREMEFGMIPIDHWATREELVGRQIPDPGCAVAQDDRLGCVHPATLAGFGPQRLAKEGWTAQVRHIRVMNGVCQRHDFTGVRLARGLDRNLKDTADFAHVRRAAAVGRCAVLSSLLHADAPCRHTLLTEMGISPIVLRIVAACS
jgi:hypothetical protein